MVLIPERPLPAPELRPLDSLRPFPRNARTHSRHQIEQIARSIQRFGFINPVLIDDKDQILAGHGRVVAARLLGHTSIPTLRFDHLTDAEKRAYVIADNKIATNAGWDRQLIAIELQELEQLGIDLDITGFDTPEVDIIFDEIAETADQPPEDVVPHYNENVTVSGPGDLWLLGRHKLMCADARKEDTFRQLPRGDKAEFVFSDPPYNVPIEGHVCGLGRIRHKNFAMGCGEMNSKEFTKFLRTIFRHLASNTVEGSIHQICMDWRHMREILAAGDAEYTEFKNLCVWNKSNGGMGTFYRSKHELVFIWKNGNASHINNFELGQHGRYRTNVWDYAGVNTFGETARDELAMHPTCKPVALIADAIKDCSRRNGIVLDPFVGSGSTVIAAERTGRQARVIEIDPHYCDVTIKRWQDYSGRPATHAVKEISFHDVSRQSHEAKGTAP